MKEEAIKILSEGRRSTQLDAVLLDKISKAVKKQQVIISE